MVSSQVPFEQVGVVEVAMAEESGRVPDACRIAPGFGTPIGYNRERSPLAPIRGTTRLLESMAGRVCGTNAVSSSVPGTVGGDG